MSTEAGEGSGVGALPTCKNCGSPAQTGGYTLPLCRVCRTALARRAFPLWIWIGVGVVALALALSAFQFPAALQAKIAYAMGQEAEARGNYGVAADHYAIAARRYPDSTRLLIRMAVASDRAGRYMDAARALESLSGREVAKEDADAANAVQSDLEARVKSLEGGQ